MIEFINNLFRKKEEKLDFTIKDLDYMFQYIILKYDTVRFYKNVFFMLIKTKEDFFAFINMLDKDYLKKSSLIYITWEAKHNENLFTHEVNDLLKLELNEELLEYLKVRVSNWMMFKKIDSEYNWLFKSKWIIFLIFVITLSGIIAVLWSQFKWIQEGSGWSVWVNMSSIFFFYENNFLITLFFLSVIVWMMIMKYIKHLPFMDLNFSKYYVLLKYKEKLYSTLLRYYISKKWKTWEIWYLNVKEEFMDIYRSIFKYLSSNEISEILFFLENENVEINVKNPLLKQDLVLDYRNFKYIQNNNVKEKIKFFQNVKDKNANYSELLKFSYEDEFEKLKWYMNLLWLALYIVVTLVVMFMVRPVLISAL